MIWAKALGLMPPESFIFFLSNERVTHIKHDLSCMSKICARTCYVKSLNLDH
jgi:hypothetical protein